MMDSAFVCTIPLDPLILPNEQSFTRDVDEKANAYFQAIYNKSMTVDKLLELLKQFKDSSVKKDRVCIVLWLPHHRLMKHNSP